MKKFIILYKSDRSPEELMRNSTPEQRKSGMEMWTQWATGAGSALVDLGNPLGNGQVVDKSGGMRAPIGVSGYSIMQAESMDEVKEKLKNHPHFLSPGMPRIEVYEMLPLSM